MPWFKVDDGFHGHPKVIELSLTAVGTWTLAGSWCANYLTDGQIGIKSIRRLGGGEGEAEELVEAGLWRDLGDGFFQFKDWEDYQPLKESVESEREAARERMQAVRAKKKGSSPARSESVQANNTRTFGRSSEEVRVTPTRPTRPDPEVSKDTSTRAHTIPDDFTLTPERKAWANENTPAVQLDRETAGFIDYWKGEQGKKKNWETTWRNWMRRKQTEAESKGWKPAQAKANYMNPANW